MAAATEAAGGWVVLRAGGRSRSSTTGRQIPPQSPHTATMQAAAATPALPLPAPERQAGLVTTLQQPASTASAAAAVAKTGLLPQSMSRSWALSTSPVGRRRRRRSSSSSSTTTTHTQ